MSPPTPTPTPTEERLRDGLGRAASAVDVDVHTLYAATRARLEEAPPAASPWRTWVPAVVAAAAAVLVVAAGVAVVDRATEGARDLSVSGEVARAFTCPERRTTTFGPRNDDDSFLPELSSSLQPRGEAAVTDNWEVEPTDDGAVLRLGNADGSLASVTTFESRDGAYAAVAVTKCTNDLPAGGEPAPLVTPGLPRSPRDATADDFAPGAVKVVDRLTYDTAGLARRQTVWAEPCGSQLCLRSGSPRTTSMTVALDGGAAVPTDLSEQLADPDDVVGQQLGLSLVALYDRTGDVADVQWSSYQGVTTSADVRDGDGWPGRLFLLLAPTSELEVVRVLPVQGEGHTYLPAQLRD
jgi:hypothetical protein